MSSLFTFNNHPTSNYQPAHVPAFQDTFELAGDDSEDDDDVPLGGGRGGSSGHNHHSAFSIPAHSTGAVASTSSTPPPPPVASSSSSSSPSLPGGYDFEPQSDPAPLLPTTSASSGGPPSVPSSTRPSLSSASSPFASRRPRAPSAAATGADETDNEADLYGRQNAGGGGGGLLGWGRGLVGRLRGHQSTPADGGATVGGAESHGLLFSQDDSDETDAETGGRGSSYPPRQGHRNIHLPLPARPPSFAPPPGASISSSSSTSSPALPTGRVFGGGSSNDGVFANLSAKPDHPSNGLDVVGEGPDKDEVLPTYDDANRDSTPPYWETTVITPGGSGFLEDEVMFDGLPVGNFFSFVWNLTVSMSFQFVGFLLTYLLHTTHAAKNGSRAGLGITLIQLGFYLKQRTDGFDPSAPGDSTGLNGAAGPSSSSWSWWDDTSSSSSPDSASPTVSALGALPTQVGAALSGALEASDPSATQGLPSLMGQDALSEEEVLEMSAQANEWMAFLMVTVGSFLLIGGCLSYWRAVRWARAIRRGQGPGADAEAAYTQ